MPKDDCSLPYASKRDESCRKVPEKKCEFYPKDIERQECIDHPRTVCTEEPISRIEASPTVKCKETPVEICNKVPKQIHRNVPRAIKKKTCQPNLENVMNLFSSSENQLKKSKFSSKSPSLYNRVSSERHPILAQTQHVLKWTKKHKPRNGQIQKDKRYIFSDSDYFPASFDSNNLKTTNLAIGIAPSDHGGLLYSHWNKT